MDEKTRARYLKDIEYFSKKLEEEPDSKVFMPLAIAYLKLGKYDEVIDVCIKGLDKNPNYLAAKTILAQAYLEKGMINEAKVLLVEVATLEKSNYRANKLLGDIYRSEGNLEKALFHYRTAHLTSPEDNNLKELIEELAEKIDAVPKTEEEIEEIEKLAETAKEIAEEVGEELSEETEDLKDESEFEIVKQEELEESLSDIDEVGEGEKIESEFEEDKDEISESELGEILVESNEGVEEEKESSFGFDDLEEKVEESEKLEPEFELEDLSVSKKEDEGIDDESGLKFETENIEEETIDAEKQELNVESSITKGDEELVQNIESDELDEEKVLTEKVAGETQHAVIDEKNQKIIDELEKWLGNIKKVKAERSV